MTWSKEMSLKFLKLEVNATHNNLHIEWPATFVTNSRILICYS